MRTRRAIVTLLASALVAPLAVVAAPDAEAAYTGYPGPVADFGTDGTAVVDYGAGAGSVTAVFQDGAGRTFVVGGNQVVMPVNVRPRTDEVRVQAYRSDGQLDPTFGDGGAVVFPTEPGDNAPVATADAQGRVLVGQTVYVPNQNRIRRLLPTGAPDPTFGTAGSVSLPYEDVGELQSIAIRPDGTIIVGANGGLYALAEDGSVLTSFGDQGLAETPSDSLLAAAAVQADGSIGAVLRYQVGDSVRLALVHYLANGLRDLVFGLDLGLGIGAVELPTNAGVGFTRGDLAIDEQGRYVVLAGETVLRVLPGLGAFDADLGGADGVDICQSLNGHNSQLAVSSGQIVVGALGPATLTRIAADGTVECQTVDLGARQMSSTPSVALPADHPGRVLLGATSFAFHGIGTQDPTLVAIDADGNLDPTFGTGGVAANNVGTGSTDVAFTASEDSAGRLLIAGGTGTHAGWRDTNRTGFGLMRLTHDGDPDPTFGTDGSVVLSDLGPATELVALLDGSLALTSSEDGPTIVRLDAAGHLAPTFGTGGRLAVPTLDRVSTLTLLDGQLLVGGTTGPTDGSSYDGAFVVLDPTTGATLPAFGGGESTELAETSAVNSIVPLEDRILVFGLEGHDGYIACWTRADHQPCADQPEVRALSDGTGPWDTFGVRDVVPSGDGGVVGLDSLGWGPMWLDAEGNLLHRVTTTSGCLGAGASDVSRLVVEPDGTTWLANFGWAWSSILVVRMDASGAVDPDFGYDGCLPVAFKGGAYSEGGPAAYGHALVITQDDRLVLAGSGADVYVSAFDLRPGSGTTTTTTTLDVPTTPTTEPVPTTPTTPTTTPPAGGLPEVTRVAGADRIATAIEVSRHDHPAAHSVHAVVLTRSDGYADALAGTPLAASLNAPVLLTPTAAVDVRVRTEIDRVLEPGGRVVVLGGPSAIASAVDGQLAAVGYQVSRYAGGDRYETAALIATEGLDRPDWVILATGTGFADSLAAGVAAARVGGALLLTDGSTLPAATSAYLSANPLVSVVAIGGPAAAAAPGQPAIVGPDRYATAVSVAGAFFGADPTEVGVASGTNFPDALAGGVHMAAAGGPMLLATAAATPSVVTDYLAAISPAKITVFGGTGAVAQPT